MGLTGTSNLIAYMGFLRSFCQVGVRYRAPRFSRVTQYLFTDCPCCILFKGLSVGLGFPSWDPLWVTLVWDICLILAIALLVVSSMQVILIYSSI